jgi:hypothetical protein
MPHFSGSAAKNINGPALLRVPDWVPDPLGRYYLYFAHHKGDYIRLASAEAVEGPYTIHPPGVLRHLGPPFIGTHVASPEIYVDEQTQTIRLYFHANLKGTGAFADQIQMTYLATSRDGLGFSVRPEQMAPFYLRVFRHGDAFYGIAKNENRDGMLLRSPDGLVPFERGPTFFPKFRHCAVHVVGETAYVVFSRAGEKPERLLASKMDLRGEWTSWRPNRPHELLRPETDYEGVHIPPRRSHYGKTQAEHALRDPCLYAEDGRLYLFYTVRGEEGIALVVIDRLHF